MINEHLDRLDFVLFGLTCRRFLQVISGLSDDIWGEFGMWHKKELVLVGGYCEAGDYPPELFSEAEIAEIRDLKVDRVRGPGEDEDEDEYYTTILQTFVWAKVSDTQRKLDFEMCRNRFKHALEQRRGNRDADTAPLSYLPEFAKDTYMPCDLKWRLVNLEAAGEYVRAEGMVVKPGYSHGPHIDHIRFAEVLMARTCWAEVHAFEHGELPIPPKGPWAGGEFVIVTDAVLQQSLRTRRRTSSTRGCGT